MSFFHLGYTYIFSHLKLQAKAFLPATTTQTIIEEFQNMHDIGLTHLLKKLHDKLTEPLALKSTTLQDTLVWDPATSLHLSCSTPNHGSSWAEVVVRGRKSGTSGDSSPPRLGLSN